GHTAVIRHIGGRADETSRLVEVLAVIDGATEALRPGAFAEVVVPVGAKRPAPVVPETAIRPSERGFLAFTVEGGKAKERILQLGMRTTDNLVEVVDGLKGGEQLVTIGGEALRDGAQVKVVPAAAPGPSRDRPASGEVGSPGAATPTVRP
ncbi:MAG: efflux RND transporter periplasmic adaptor subunit, partial [Deltaproteobacteria bacterium]|nr:efflux RND transporter periplasmic adaptor subunit [Deltaproteobacteria bacterium]